MNRWPYTSLSFMDGWMEMEKRGMEKSLLNAGECQPALLDGLGESGWEVYEIKFDNDGQPLYFLRLLLNANGKDAEAQHDQGFARN
jgi:hypothetical protein